MTSSMTSFTSHKQHLRLQYKTQRDALSTYEILKLSNEIVKIFSELPSFLRANVVACYVSFGSEVFTHGFIRKYCTFKDVLVPVVNQKTGTLALSHLMDWSELDIGAFGILEPQEKFLRLQDSKNADIVVVPGVVFDVCGNRIGYGGGYYDRLLSNTMALKIAFAYDFQVLSELPFESHDRRVDLIVTERRVVDVSN